MLQIRAADDGSIKVEGVAYTGGLMDVGWGALVVIDFSGLTIPDEVPLLANHENRTESRVGVVTVELADGNLTLSGEIAGTNDVAKHIIDQLKAGVGWQLSVGAKPELEEFVVEGVTRIINGQEFTGPFYHVIQATLREVSVVPIGADDDTSLSIAASFQMFGGHGMKGTKKDEKTVLEAAAAAAAAKETAGETETTPEPETKIVQAAAQSAVSADAEKDIKAYRQSMADERARVAQIQTVCGSDHPAIEAKAIIEGWDVTKTELEVLRASRSAAPAVHIGGADAGPQVLEAAALLTGQCKEAGLLKAYGEQTLEAASRLKIHGLREFIEAVAGVSLPRFESDKKAWLRAAFSSLSLPGILSNVANKMLLEGFSYTEQAWRDVARIGSVRNFQSHTRYRMTSDMKFEQVGPDGELKHGTVSELSYSQQADTYGKMFSITRQQLINDDLSAFMDIPRQIGMGAGDAINHAFWTLVLANTGSFFHADNSNLVTGATSALTHADGLKIAETAFLNQTKPNGTPLGMEPAVLLVPTDLKVRAMEIDQSPVLAFTTTANKGMPTVNIYSGRFKLATSAYLRNTSYSGYSATAWYLFADPKRLAAFEVAFLNGQDAPTVEQAEADFNTLGIQFRGYLDFGVAQQECRAAVKSAGA